jgi:hypothetical protein
MPEDSQPPLPLPAPDTFELSAKVPPGFVPVEILQGDRLTVRWRAATDVQLAHPFFDADIECGCAQRDIFTDLAGLVRSMPGSTDGAPAGIIGHISRCGSTLVANGLRRLGVGPVLSEPQPISVILGALAGVAPDLAKRCLIACGAAWSLELAGGRPLVLKLPSWGLNRLDLVLEAWPDCPWALCVRAPSEVVASMRKRPPDWASVMEQKPHGPRLGFTTMVLEGQRLSSERAIFALLQSAVSVPRPPVCVLDYANLDSTAILDLADRFYGSLAISNEDHAALSEEFNYDAKSSGREVFSRFESTGAAEHADSATRGLYIVARNLVSPEIRAASPVQSEQ